MVENKDTDNTTEETVDPAKLNLFLTTSTECPLCEGEVPGRHIKTSLYSERDKDVVMRPQTVKWNKKGLSGFHPRLYYMRYCPSCHFTADSDIFNNPTKNISLTAAKFAKRFAALHEQDEYVKKIVHKLTADIDVLDIDFYQAVRLHLLAIFQFQMFDEIAQKDAMDLGKYCLRLAWLYRDLSELKTISKKQMSRIITFVKSLQVLWPQMPANEKVALLMASQYYQTTLESSYRIETSLDEINLLMIISRIYMKLGDITKAHLFLGRGKEKFRRFERETNELMRLSALAEKSSSRRKEDSTNLPQKKVSEEQLAEMITDSRKLKFITETAQRFFEDVRDELEAKLQEKAKKILEGHQDKPVEELRRILLDHKIDKRVILKLFPEKRLKKKKGFLNIFN